jgi:hypothetical protein
MRTNKALTLRLVRSFAESQTRTPTRQFSANDANELRATTFCSFVRSDSAANPQPPTTQTLSTPSTYPDDHVTPLAHGHAPADVMNKHNHAPGLPSTPPPDHFGIPRRRPELLGFRFCDDHAPAVVQ